MSGRDQKKYRQCYNRSAHKQQPTVSTPLFKRIMRGIGKLFSRRAKRTHRLAA